MAEMQDTHHSGAHGRRSTISTITNMIGAAASLALIAGICVWSYQLLMRDVSGVPVVRAVEGPMRLQPENPGGELAQHIGYSVNDVAAVGGAAAPADQVVLAPAPLELTLEDEALPSVGQAEAAEQLPGDFLNPDDLQLAAVAQLAEQLSEGVDPLQELEPLAEAQPSTEEEILAAIAEATGVEPPVVRPADVDAAQAPAASESVATSLRPKMRPADLSNIQEVSAVEPAAARPEVDPDTIPVGTRLAQLGAFDSVEVARSEWDRLETRFSEYLSGKSRVIQKASSGGRTFYRLRVMGFADLSDARRFCSALVAERAECIPVVTR